MQRVRRGFSLVELLVVTAIMGVLLGIALPALTSARRRARSVLNTNNQRNVVDGVTNYALDHDDRYPESVATVGVQRGHWNWQEPMMLTGFRSRSPRHFRSMGAYLGEYIGDAETMTCPSAPGGYPYLREVWQAGNSWDHPDTLSRNDPVYGTYCFYWNYLGYLDDSRVPFTGPRKLSEGRRKSTMLISDYFGYDHWRCRDAFSSCEDFEDAEVTEGTVVSSPFWSWVPGGECADGEGLEIELRAGYTDGHVESYGAQHVVPMWVSITKDGTVPYPAGVGPGAIYVPLNSLHR